MTNVGRQVGALLLTLMLLVVSGCSSGGEISGSKNNSSGASSEDKISSDYTSPSVSSDDSSLSKVSTPENDTGIGLKNIKIDTQDRELTDEQKAVITYFDNDYLTVSDYDFLRRYPNIFEGAQITLCGIVDKVLSMDKENYKIALCLNTELIYGWSYMPDNGKYEYVILNGKTGSSAWLMEGDVILVSGRYTSIETVDIDGTSYTIPTVEVYNTHYDSSRLQFMEAEKFDYPFIKVVAEAIFGKDIEIREPVAGEDLSMDEAMMEYFALGYTPYAGMAPSEISEYMDLLVELEDQSNANFKKFRFSKYKGEIVDAKGPFDSGIERNIEFSADFEHFFLFTRNESLESLKLAYYDKSFNKVWEREFEENTSAVYDYTETNLYIVVNNELYIINMETGEDVFAPSYVGEKKEIRKFSDGIVIVSASKSDGVMKISLNGDIIWKANLSADALNVNGLQLVNGNIVLDYEDADWNQHYCLIDSSTGEMLIDTSNTDLPGNEAQSYYTSYDGYQDVSYSRSELYSYQKNYLSGHNGYTVELMVGHDETYFFMNLDWGNGQSEWGEVIPGVSSTLDGGTEVMLTLEEDECSA